MPYLSNLDGIRAIAVLLVVASHIALMLVTEGQDHPAYSFKAMGHVGVAIFFVHTTLVLMASLERHGPATVPFYIRRFFRIYPLSVAVVLFLALLRLIGGLPIDTDKLLSNLFLVQNLTGHRATPDPLWTLPYEVQMYLVLPTLYGITKTRRSVMWASLLCAASVLMVLAMEPKSPEYRVLQFVPCFLPGVLAFALTRRVRARVSPAVLFGMIAVLGLIAIPMLVAAGVPENPLMWTLCLVLGLMIPLCREMTHKRLAEGSKVIATYSYGIYITHVFALGLATVIPGPAIVRWAVMLLLLPLFAYVCYHGIEKHGIALGSRLAAKFAAKQKPAPVMPASEAL